jgi:YfiH family protein
VKPLREPLLCALAPDHGFGVRGSSGPPGLACPRQVHGAVVVRAEACLAAEPAEADGVISLRGGPPVGVVTADCVPVLLASDDGAGVAALHAGWRGLAAGVLEAGVRALAEASGAAPGGFAAGVGPHIGACCYEVDEPVLEALARRHAEALPAAVRATRPGHARLDLGALTRRALRRAGLAADRIGTASVACTACEAERFHSHRRDAERAGRMVHFITPGRGAEQG